MQLASVNGCFTPDVPKVEVKKLWTVILLPWWCAGFRPWRFLGIPLDKQNPKILFPCCLTTSADRLDYWIWNPDNLSDSRNLPSILKKMRLWQIPDRRFQSGSPKGIWAWRNRMYVIQKPATSRQNKSAVLWWLEFCYFCRDQAPEFRFGFVFRPREWSLWSHVYIHVSASPLSWKTPPPNTLAKTAHSRHPFKPPPVWCFK